MEGFENRHDQIAGLAVFLDEADQAWATARKLARQAIEIGQRKSGT
jgi:hypothetical protein